MIPKREFLQNLEDAIAVLSRQPDVPKLSDEMLAFGDLHGDHGTLVRATKIHELTNIPVIFLGDYVDRGTEQIQTLNAVAGLIANDPKNFHAVRGNHEDFDICSRYGFFNELRKHYDIDSVLPTISEFFKQLPLAAVMPEYAFMAHGGIPETNHPLPIDTIKKAPNPIKEPIPLQITFNDPIESQPYAEPIPDSPGFYYNSRGPSVRCFDENAAKEFLTQNSLKYIVRAHVAIINGFEKYNDHVYSLFSSKSGVYDRFKPGFAILRKGEEPELHHVKTFLKKSK